MDSSINVADQSIINQDKILMKDSIISNDSYSKKQLEEINKKPESKNSWNFGITFSTGISSTVSNIFGNSQKSIVYSSPGNTTGSGNVLIPTPSVLKSSLALITGIVIEKNISKSTSLTTGLNYKLYHLKSTVGSDSTIYYRADNSVNTYHHLFHYIELPVGFKFHIIKFKNTSLSVNTGLSISQLIGSNALQYNYISGYYYHDNSLLNKTLVGFTLGIDATLFSNRNRPILIGPYLNFELTKTADEGYQQHHFIYTGLRAQYLFRKK
jgi:hypothetical protein